jgi:hypothetical protein
LITSLETAGNAGPLASKVTLMSCFAILTILQSFASGEELTHTAQSTHPHMHRNKRSLQTAPEALMLAYSCIIRGVSFCVGYSESLEVRGGRLLPVGPFGRAQVFCRLGWVECKTQWDLSESLETEQLVIKSVPFQSWMLVDFDDVIRAVALCESCSIRLPRYGYSRV